ncbi:MAG: alpha/beta fold hydrolase [Flavobacteriales bacterium]|nr:alpha/beta fold hydrolase [Flavobacteriales bacterium]
MVILAYIVGLYALIFLLYTLFQEQIIFRSNRRKQQGKYRISARFEELQYDTPHGGSIHGVLMHPKEESKGLIFYLHGNTGSIKRWGVVAQELLDLGFDVFIMDYRGYGKSKGRKSERVMHSDARHVYQQLAPNYDYNVVYGRSLGAAFAVRLACLEKPSKLVLETPFFSLLSLAQKIIPFLPMRAILRFPMRSDRLIDKVECPIIIFHGTKDRIVPYASGFRLYSVVKDREDVEMVTIPGATHNNLNAYPTFWEKLKLFLQS